MLITIQQKPQKDSEVGNPTIWLTFQRAGFTIRNLLTEYNGSEALPVVGGTQMHKLSAEGLGVAGESRGCKLVF